MDGGKTQAVPGKEPGDTPKREVLARRPAVRSMDKGLTMRQPRERIDPWKWYCRVDGEAGEYPTPEERDAAARKHRDEECATKDRPHPRWAEAGRLVHVWRY